MEQSSCRLLSLFSCRSSRRLVTRFFFGGNSLGRKGFMAESDLIESKQSYGDFGKDSKELQHEVIHL